MNIENGPIIAIFKKYCDAKTKVGWRRGCYLREDKGQWCESMRVRDMVRVRDKVRVRVTV